MNLECIKLKKVTQLQKEKSVMFSLMQNLDKTLCIYVNACTCGYRYNTHEQRKYKKLTMGMDVEDLKADNRYNL